MRCLHAMFIFLSFGICAIAQELQTWVSSSGHKTEAQFLRIDEKAGTITLLIPRTIRLDQLDASSIALARRLAARAATNGTVHSSIRQSNATGVRNSLTTRSHPVATTLDAPQSRTDAVEFEGQTRYIHGIIVWGVRDFQWYDPSIELPNDPTKITILRKRYGVEKMPNNAAVKLVDRRRHPVSSTWVYQVKLNGSLYWVLADELRDSP